MFSQSVLNVSQSDSFTNNDTTRWGENKTTTDSDQGEHTTDEGNAEDDTEDTSTNLMGWDNDDQVREPLNVACENKTEEEYTLGEDYEE